MFGLSLGTFTLLHVVISLIGIASGLVAMIGWLKSDPSRTATAIFLATTILTGGTGFLFPLTKLLPSHIIGIISLVMLALATIALYVKRLSGFWRPVYAVTAVLSLYLNVFVLLVQGFMKVAPLKALAPTQTEPVFVVAQGILFLLFLSLTILTALRFRPQHAAI